MLAPCYLVHGGEPLQTDEIITAIHHLAAKNGYNSKVVFEINTQFEWEDLLNKCLSLDLFADRTTLELRLHSDSVSKTGNQMLEQILQQQDSNFCIIIRANKLKAQTLNSSWVKHIQAKGQVKLAKPIPSDKWSAWVKQRLHQAGFTISPEALELLAKSFAGNLLACAQCIDKLRTLHTGHLDLEQIKPVLYTNAHYTVFDLANALTTGSTKEVTHILHCLQTDQIEPALVLWSVARTVRNTPHTQLLSACKQADLIIKGIEPGNIWDHLSAICLRLSTGKMEEYAI